MKQKNPKRIRYDSNYDRITDYHKLRVTWLSGYYNGKIPKHDNAYNAITKMKERINKDVSNNLDSFLYFHRVMRHGFLSTEKQLYHHLKRGYMIKDPKLSQYHKLVNENQNTRRLLEEEYQESIMQNCSIPRIYELMETIFFNNFKEKNNSKDFEDFQIEIANMLIHFSIDHLKYKKLRFSKFLRDDLVRTQEIADFILKEETGEEPAEDRMIKIPFDKTDNS